ncbi:GH92 family glycosyl hydrolase [Dysgonomonas sp. ZJ279]|uniref:GH92 family glycosyl hydrolase n=1 Tax=Dysgonomonas sp. ZJ279 TaxID=2709796 RepID=UPI0013EB60ED|nr:GH92 family glycosyl hydrolase [Dysgonomonas sp. ZJ279]
MKKKISNFIVLFLLAVFTCNAQVAKTPVDYVNPYMGNISHLLVPTYPTVHLPFSMLRVYPERADFTSDQVAGLPVIVTSHRGSSAFNISPINGGTKDIPAVKSYSYDNEKITPYRYSVYLDDEHVTADFAPSHQAAVYSIDFEKAGDNMLVVNTRNGKLDFDGSVLSGYQIINRNGTKVYLYLETQQKVDKAGSIANNTIDYKTKSVDGKNQAIALVFKDKQINVRYGISFISSEQAKKNLKREINTYSVDEVAQVARTKWNEVLGKIMVEGDDLDNKTIFYTSLYRTYERMINISEDGNYYSAFTNTVKSDEGTPFYTDDWIWDTYRATHPLRVLIEADAENDMVSSYIRMAQQTEEGWMPTFPEVTGDSHRMNGNHAVAVVWDAYCKGLRGYDLEAAYKACKGAMTEKSWLPWTRIPNTEWEAFYEKNGYFPALKVGEKEYIKGAHSWEKRQPVAVTLGACYDDWCLAQIAKQLGKTDDYKYFLNRSYNYRNLYNAQTAFFHPKDSDGNFIEPFDYRYSGGMGARDYYSENNAYVYRWDVPHNPADLISLMGSPKNFVDNLNQTFREPLGKSKFEFYAQLPDHTGNVGQFSMANEPSLHIPYLYNYAGQPWMTQKRIRTLLKEWFRNDLMGVPGDEDGGGTSAFVVFSAMGFYPVTPGSPTYNIGSPLFKNAKMTMSNGKVFEVEAVNCSDENKYIQSATLNGKTWDKPWFSHSDIANGGKLVLIMGNKANTKWGAAPENVPPSAEKL